MILNLNASMAEVTRLTRAGRLTEAMAILQGSPPKPKAPQSDDRRPTENPPSGRPSNRHDAAALGHESLDGIWRSCTTTNTHH
jgi:hypothetical protein